MLPSIDALRCCAVLTKVQAILHAVGIGGGAAAAGVVETGDLIEAWRRATDSLWLG